MLASSARSRGGWPAVPAAAAEAGGSETGMRSGRDDCTKIPILEQSPPTHSMCNVPDPASASAIRQITPATETSCALFCRVVDNFGDAGVCWRLARQLRREYGWRVRLYIDLPEVLRAFLPDAPAFAEGHGREALAQRESEASDTGMHGPAAALPRNPCEASALPTLATIDGVAILCWPGLGIDGAPRPDGVVWPDGADPGDIVIEAFACELPDAVLTAMAARATPPVWLNLEYLSAEDWVTDCHLMPSRHPRHGLEKTFFFPGLQPGTGGVLRERDLDADRRNFLDDPEAQTTFWRTLGLDRPATDQFVITLFAYENPTLDGLLHAWSNPWWHAKDTPGSAWHGITVLVPHGRITSQAAAFFQRDTLRIGETLQRGALTVRAIPFLSQPDYDRLLWLADLNFVRGEDSFVRAQWARRPFVWHIYPQEGAAHVPKLDAALTAYCTGAALSAGAAAAMRAIWYRWNRLGGLADAPSLTQAMDLDWLQTWRDYVGQWSMLRHGGVRWAEHLQAPGDLAGNLVRFYAGKRGMH
ncbi:elongation factor P maturation arginine rhamnosyltransferase EarP [Robbsia andropogonis]|uniref:elongation factor P maturation arginine rhamnosyltransferase EarP n=1 Tax=Robbsia andropogonis TaxID=28092 RepID=UPI0036F3D53A